jgi:anion-transporting  ArsA/GET3 family ATPase
MSYFFDLIKDSEVLVCVGSGGVGKTTIASAIALTAAQAGKRVLVLTIDPSQRLKSTMGIKESHEIIRIENNSIQGELWASLIDPQKTFDEFILRASKQSETAKKLLQNKLYIQLSTTLSGSQEFTALEKLYSAKETQKYDLIVLDTPPTKHAIDFLEAPEKLSSLFQDSVAKWFRVSSEERQSLFVKILHSGTQKVLQALEILTGSEFMKELSEFFKSIDTWQDKLEKRIHDVHKLLIDSKTRFVLVSSIEEAKIKEAEFFAKEIKKGGYQLSTIIINKAYPQWMLKNKDFVSDSEYENQIRKFYIQKNEKLDKMNLQVKNVIKLPELTENISDFAGVIRMSEELKNVP